MMSARGNCATKLNQMNLNLVQVEGLPAFETYVFTKSLRLSTYERRLWAFQILQTIFHKCQPTHLFYCIDLSFKPVFCFPAFLSGSLWAKRGKPCGATVKCALEPAIVKKRRSNTQRVAPIERTNDGVLKRGRPLRVCMSKMGSCPSGLHVLSFMNPI
jgi:hypothetical protein